MARVCKSDINNQVKKIWRNFRWGERCTLPSYEGHKRSNLEICNVLQKTALLSAGAQSLDAGSSFLNPEFNYSKLGENALCLCKLLLRNLLLLSNRHKDRNKLAFACFPWHSHVGLRVVAGSRWTECAASPHACSPVQRRFTGWPDCEITLGHSACKTYYTVMAQKRPDRPTRLKQRGMTPSLCEPTPMLGIMGGYGSWQLSLIVSDTCTHVRVFSLKTALFWSNNHFW